MTRCKSKHTNTHLFRTDLSLKQIQQAKELMKKMKTSLSVFVLIAALNFMISNQYSSFLYPNFMIEI